MQVEKTNNDRSLTLAQIEFCDQLKRSDQSGQALWWPRVAAGESAPDCVVLIEEICRFGVMFPPGRYSVEGGNWYRHDADGKTEVPDLIEAAWQAARQIRLAIKGELRRGAYTIPVIIFNDMEPNAGILEAAQGRGCGCSSGRTRWSSDWSTCLTRSSCSPGWAAVTSSRRWRC